MQSRVGNKSNFASEIGLFCNFLQSPLITGLITVHNKLTSRFALIIINFESVHQSSAEGSKAPEQGKSSNSAPAITHAANKRKLWS